MAATTVTFIRSSTSELVNPLTVNFTVGGTATFTTDYTVTGATSFTTTTGSVVIPANQTQAVITLTSVADAVVEPDETVILTLVPTANVSSGTGSVTWTIIDDDNIVGTVFLSNFNGANNSITAIDISANPTPITLFNGAVISTLQSRFGGASLMPTSGAAYITHAPKLDLGGGLDFTIEAWIRRGTAGTPDIKQIMFKANSYMWYISGNNLVFHIFGTFTVNIFNVTSPVSNNFIHTAITKSGNTYRLFYDGVLNSTVTNTTVIANNTNDVYFGASSSTATTNFFVDDARITRGTALYTAAFTPPAAAFTS